MALDDRSVQVRDEIRRLLRTPSLDYFYSAEFGSANSKACSDWRDKLQVEVEKKLKIDSNYSVSHSNFLRGAAFVADRDGRVGFDVEETERVLAAVALRVSDENQLGIAPTAAALFVAKEAAFKSLRGPRQPKILSEVEIINWKAHDPRASLHLFTARLKGKEFQWFGVCFEDTRHTIGLSVFPHSSDVAFGL